MDLHLLGKPVPEMVLVPQDLVVEAVLLLQGLDLVVLEMVEVELLSSHIPLDKYLKT